MFHNLIHVYLVDNASAPYEYDYWRKVVDRHKQNLPEVRKINNAWYSHILIAIILH